MKHDPNPLEHLAHQQAPWN